MLNVFIGYACNLGCGYCLQAPEGARGPATPLTRRRAQAFVARVAPWIRAHNVRRIAYWGGEPLIYWRTIAEIHEALLSEGLAFEMVKFVTNGTLLEDGHVETLNRWGAYVVVSRHEDPALPRWDKVARLRLASISYLFRSGVLLAWSWLREVDELEQRYGRLFFPYMHWIRATDGARPSYHLTLADLDSHVPHLWTLARLAVDGHRHAGSLWRGHLAQWQSDLRPDADAPAMCHGDHQIDVDLDGNRYGCHHTVSAELQLGPLDGPIDNPAALAQVRRFVDSAECRVCPIRSWCRGNCHLSRTHDVDCRLSKEKHAVLSWLSANWRERKPATPIFAHS